MAGGYSGNDPISSVLLFPPGAKAWIPVASLPRPLENAQGSIFGEKFRVYGGVDDERVFRSEVLVVAFLLLFSCPEQLNRCRQQ